MHSWPCGHSIDSEEAIEFTELQNVNCMVEKYPLEKANEAFSELFQQSTLPQLTLDHRCNDEGLSEIQRRDHHGLKHECTVESWRKLTYIRLNQPAVWKKNVLKNVE